MKHQPTELQIMKTLLISSYSELMRFLQSTLSVAFASAFLLLLTSPLSHAGHIAMKGERAGALPLTSFQDISSAGPLTHVYIGSDLSAQVNHVADGTTGEFYPPGSVPGDSGTFIAMNGELYAPDFGSHGVTATNGLGTYTPFTPVSQTGVTGSGTASDPFKVVTTVNVGATGLLIQQTDTYIVGDESYHSNIMITNSGGTAANGVLYRAADSFLSGSDSGYGFTETFGTANAVGCSVNPDNNPPGRIEEWIPSTGGNSFYQASYGSIWSWIGTKTPFPDTCDCEILEDNGSGISWNFSIPGGSSATYSQSTAFSPLGKEPLVTSKTADSDTSQPGAQNGYTITLSNPNPDPVSVTSVTDTLPGEFSYITGSTTGFTTSDPTINGQNLTWTGPFLVAASSSVSLHFEVTVAIQPGDYFNEAGGDADGGYTVTGTGPTAEVTVTSNASLTLLKAGSRVWHFGVGAFDIDMPLTGNSGVEDRCSNTYTAVFTFDDSVTSGDVAIVSGSATVESVIGNGDELQAKLKNVTDAEILTLRVSNINGDGQQYGDIPFGFLQGDVNANRVVDKPDANQIRLDKNQTINGSNFRDDIDLSGVVDRKDLHGVTSHLGNSLP